MIIKINVLIYVVYDFSLQNNHVCNLAGICFYWTKANPWQALIPYILYILLLLLFEVIKNYNNNSIPMTLKTLSNYKAVSFHSFSKAISFIIII